MQRLLAPALAAAALLTCCGGQEITADKLAASVDRSFANTYAAELAELGQPGATAAQVVSSTICQRTTPGVKNQGSGDDWACVVSFVAADGSAQQARYETKVRTNGCWTVDGPAAILGPQTLVAADGKNVTNRLLEMDGCFSL